MLITCDYPDLGSGTPSDWIKQISNQSVTLTQIWVVTRHRYGMSGLARSRLRRHFAGKTPVAS